MTTKLRYCPLWGISGPKSGPVSYWESILKKTQDLEMQISACDLEKQAGIQLHTCLQIVWVHIEDVTQYQTFGLVCHVRSHSCRVQPATESISIRFPCSSSLTSSPSQVTTWSQCESEICTFIHSLIQETLPNQKKYLGAGCITRVLSRFWVPTICVPMHTRRPRDWSLTTS
jgi:hypothetical protein